MKKFWISFIICSLLINATGVFAQETAQKKKKKGARAEWVQLFDGKTLNGWESFDKGRWRVDENGVVIGEGPMGHLISNQSYTNLEFKLEVKLNNKGNSGMYIRAAKGPGWPKGYEAQIENTSSDPQRTGSLYNLSKVTEQLIPDDTWWTQHVIAIGNRIVIRVNDKTVVDFVDTKNTYTSGHLALQQHNDGSIVMFRNVKVRALPANEKTAWTIVGRDLPELVKEKPAAAQ